MQKRNLLNASVAAALALTAGSATAATDQERIQQLEQTVQEMKAMMEIMAGMPPAKLQEMFQSMQAMEQKVDQANQAAEAAAQAVERAETTRQAKADKVHIGGYGELHYNNLDAEDSSRDLQEIDFHRFVLFFGYDFTDKLRFFSELELEHSIAGEGQGGEVELEQAYLQYDITERQSALGGLFILPVGILNETHEPPTFYGVERNDVENIIIPATWWEGGGMYTYNFDNGIGLDVALHSGLEIPTTGTSAFRVRSGRNKVSNARADDLATTGRIRYTGIPGVTIAGSVQYQADPSGDRSVAGDSNGGDGLDSGLLYTGNIDATRGPFGFRALYAEWDFDGDAVEAANADEQKGWYVEPSYKILPQVGLYTRYSDLEGARTQDKFDQWEFGVNFWPNPDVVLKADFRTRDHDETADSGRDFDGFDLGLGYQF